MSTSYIRVERDQSPKWRTCGFRGCTSFASHVLMAGKASLVYCCAQCAAVGVEAHMTAVGDWWVFNRRPEQQRRKVEASK